MLKKAPKNPLKLKKKYISKSLDVKIDIVIFLSYFVEKVFLNLCLNVFKFLLHLRQKFWYSEDVNKNPI